MIKPGNNSLNEDFFFLNAGVYEGENGAWFCHLFLWNSGNSRLVNSSQLDCCQTRHDQRAAADHKHPSWKVSDNIKAFLFPWGEPVLLFFKYRNAVWCLCSGLSGQIATFVPWPKTESSSQSLAPQLILIPAKTSFPGKSELRCYSDNPLTLPLDEDVSKEKSKAYEDID